MSKTYNHIPNVTWNVPSCKFNINKINKKIHNMRNRIHYRTVTIVMAFQFFRTVFLLMQENKALLLKKNLFLPYKNLR